MTVELCHVLALTLRIADRLEQLTLPADSPLQGGGVEALDDEVALVCGDPEFLPVQRSLGDGLRRLVAWAKADLIEQHLRICVDVLLEVLVLGGLPTLLHLLQPLIPHLDVPVASRADDPDPLREPLDRELEAARLHDLFQEVLDQLGAPPPPHMTEVGHQRPHHAPELPDGGARPLLRGLLPHDVLESARLFDHGARLGARGGAREQIRDEVRRRQVSGTRRGPRVEDLLREAGRQLEASTMHT
mmetsp:Transcript_19267/g.55970  ORF Transcript_19267/g.55970 Transcript_19267/m.55970 type:complete len:245 (+) Transcript_19267:584-1318(+)